MGKLKIRYKIVSTLKMAEACSSETFVQTYNITQCQNPDHNINVLELYRTVTSFLTLINSKVNVFTILQLPSKLAVL
jgi:hypothetical protein